MNWATWFWLIAARSAVAKHLQPVRVRLAGQQLGRTFVNALETFATQKAAMVEEELQQVQIARADLPAQEKVASQPAVDVFDDRTGTHHLLAQSTHGLFDRVETTTQLFAQGRLFLPTPRLALVERLQVEQFADSGEGRLELGGELGQVLVELPRESQELVAVILEQRAIPGQG